jgi:sulfide dehydrogenase cytochrome subunit
MKRILLAALVTLGLLPITGLTAVDPKVIAGCEDCHGANGVSGSQDVPSIAGFSATTLSEALKAYHAKTRPCPKVNYKRGDTQRQGDMCSAAKDFTDTEIADLSAYFERQSHAAMKQAFDAAKAAAGKEIHDRDCKKCHSKGGKDPADDAGILAGQPLDWIKSSLASAKNGEGEHTKKMKEVVVKLSDADIESLAHYYASEQ